MVPYCDALEGVLVSIPAGVSEGEEVPIVAIGVCVLEVTPADTEGVAVLIPVELACEPQDKALQGTGIRHAEP